MECTPRSIVSAHTRSLRAYVERLELEKMAGTEPGVAQCTALAAADREFLAELLRLLEVDACDS